MEQSIEATRLGQNRTGLQASPLSQEMTDVVQPVSAQAVETSALNSVRQEYIRDADPLGSVPPPPTVKGMAKSAFQMLKGDRPQVFIDKLAERLAYERGGTRLYDAVIAKCMASQDELPGGASLQELTAIRDEEASHAALIKACLEQLGADPTAQTPCADLVGVMSTGLLQAATDPRTTLVQTLQVALAAELVDVASWEMLIGLAENMGQDDMAGRFRRALEHENEHLAKVRGWCESLTLATGELAGTATTRSRKPN